jgi:hypothetical protein
MFEVFLTGQFSTLSQNNKRLSKSLDNVFLTSSITEQARSPTCHNPAANDREELPNRY